MHRKYTYSASQNKQLGTSPGPVYFITPSASITINTSSNWFTGWAQDRHRFGNYTDTQFRAETLLHELLHVYGRVEGLAGANIKPHPEGDSFEFDKETFPKCFGKL